MEWWQAHGQKVQSAAIWAAIIWAWYLTTYFGLVGVTKGVIMLLAPICMCKMFDTFETRIKAEYAKEQKAYEWAEEKSYYAFVDRLEQGARVMNENMNSKPTHTMDALIYKRSYYEHLNEMILRLRKYEK